MNDPSPSAAFSPTLERARALAARSETLQAELLYLKLLEQSPSHREVLTELAGLALQRDDLGRALQFLQRALAARPADLRLALEVAQLLWRGGDPDQAQSTLEDGLRRAPRGDAAGAMAWLALGQLRNARGQHDAAARAWHQAFQRAHATGEWRQPAALPSDLRALIERARDAARAARRAHLADAYHRLPHEADALARVDRALASIMGEADVHPADPRQRPKFLYFPDLPSEPYLDPYRVPWARRLVEAFPAVREEALGLLSSGEPLPTYFDFDPGDRLGDYLGGTAAKPAWDAFFFYRRGERYDDNHRRCPQTSALLESIELFRIPGHAPEICFSFLAPHTTIKPHYGVSNTRLVMHLPLVVPPDCALNLLGAGEHPWQEGRPVLFDDTYQHEAWNRSDRMRIVLLMDCWNPGLTPLERDAVAALMQASNEFDRAL